MSHQHRVWQLLFLKICPWVQHPEDAMVYSLGTKTYIILFNIFLSIEKQHFLVLILPHPVCYFAQTILRPKSRGFIYKMGLVMVPTHRAVRIKWVGGCVSWILAVVAAVRSGCIAQSSLRFGSFPEIVCLKCGTSGNGVNKPWLFINAEESWFVLLIGRYD